MDLQKVSVSILVKNSEKYLKECLDSLKDFGEILVLDNGSTDKTQKIAMSYTNVSWHEHPFEGFGFMKNKAAELAKNSWILNIDSDEVLTPSMINDLKNWNEEPTKVVSFLRDNHYRGRLIKACNWHPDRVYRLYNKENVKFSSAKVHEKLEFDNSHHVPFDSTLLHYTYDSIDELIAKMNHYSTLFAEENVGKKRLGIIAITVRTFLTFVKNYFLKKGFLYGYPGFVISVCNTGFVFFKYMKLYELNQSVKKTK